MNQKLPKILFVTRSVWDDSKGTSSTLSNIFCNYNPEQLSCIYIETKKPNTKICNTFFQISEISLIKKIFKWNTKTGQEINSEYIESDSLAKMEASTMNYVRHHRSFFYTFLREILWAFNGWKSKELKAFVKKVNPDIIRADGSPLILMNRLSKYITKLTRKPYCVYEMDDVYTYKISNHNPFRYIYKYFLRKNVSQLITNSSQLFVISPKMKTEYDKIFNVNSKILTKGIDYSDKEFKPYKVVEPIKMVYMGQIIYDRLSVLQELGKIIDDINVVGKKIQLDIYTTNHIDEEIKSSITQKGNVKFNEPVPYDMVAKVIDEHDVVVYAESLNKQYGHVARLSFSTKITDYLASGKCVLAIGPKNIAPMEYLKNEDAAIVANSYDELREILIADNLPKLIEEYSMKGFYCGLKNHNKKDIDKMVVNILMDLNK